MVNPSEQVESDALLSALLGKNVMTKEKALEIPAVQACINLIAGTISLLPVNLYQKDKEGNVREVRDRRTSLLNNDTGDTLTASQFWRAIIEDYYLGKGGYAYINKPGTEVESIHYVDETRISIMKNTDPIFKDYDILVRGKSYRPYQFFKILRKTKDGMTSRSVTDDNQLIIGVSYSELTYERNLVQKGGNKKGFLKSPKKLTRDAMNALKAAFRRLYSNAEETAFTSRSGSIRFTAWTTASATPPLTAKPLPSALAQNSGSPSGISFQSTLLASNIPATSSKVNTKST